MLFPPDYRSRADADTVAADRGILKVDDLQNQPNSPPRRDRVAVLKTGSKDSANLVATIHPMAPPTSCRRQVDTWPLPWHRWLRSRAAGFAVSCSVPALYILYRRGRTPPFTNFSRCCAKASAPTHSERFEHVVRAPSDAAIRAKKPPIPRRATTRVDATATPFTTVRDMTVNRDREAVDSDSDT
jgi:hypothetical protein